MNPTPAFFIVCGDLVDAMPDQWPQIRESQEKDFFRVFSKLSPDIPLVCVCGNHDVGKHFLSALGTRALIHLAFYCHCRYVGPFAQFAYSYTCTCK